MQSEKYITIQDLIKDVKKFAEIHNLDDDDILIYGSHAHKFTSGLKYRCNDVDLLINNAKYNHVIGINEDYKMDKDCYTFSKNITHSGMLNNLHISFTTKDLKKFIEEDLMMDFLKNYITLDGKCNKKINDNINIDISTGDMFSNNLRNTLRKYASRGVKYNIVSDISTENLDIINKLNDYKTDYKNLGLVVLPLSDSDRNGMGKAPRVKLWNTLDRKFDFIPKSTDNIGILVGKNSGIICLDIDAKDNGVFYFNLLKENYFLPEGPVQQTPNGGFHYIFKYKESKMKRMESKIKCLTCNNVKIGIDLLINKSQFVVEPSINKVNKIAYKWLVPPTDDNIPEAPQWIYDMHKYGKITSDGLIIKKNINAHFRENVVSVLNIFLNKNKN